MREARYRILAEINMTPMVDAIMVILIIFMITAPMMQRGVEVQLPRAQARQVDVETGIVISMTIEGSIFIGELEVGLDEIETVLGRIKKYGRERPVFVKADKDLPYGSVLDVIARVKRAGIYNVGLITSNR
jgi:biopolymer transport protein TolR